jgi:hypothetical protein
LSQPVTAVDGPAWLRVACAPVGQVVATFWDGSIKAQESMPDLMPRPWLRVWHDWSDDRWEYRAELYDRVAVRPVAVSASLSSVPDLPSRWWVALRAALDDIAMVSTRRATVDQSFLDRAMPHFLGVPVDTVAPSWSTAHGDLHWANLCAPELRILDWEGWGLAPTGYDAAVLHTHSLLTPSVAARVRTELGYVLETPAGRFAELVVITELLEAITRGDNLELAGPLRTRAAQLLRRSVPLPTGEGGPGEGDLGGVLLDGLLDDQ